MRVDSLRDHAVAVRRFLVFSLTAVTAVIAWASAGSGASDQRLPSTPPVVAGYNLRAQFEVELFVGWGQQSGDDLNAACSVWWTQSGTNRVKARSVKPIRGLMQIHRRRTSQIRVGGRNVPVSWGNLTAVGRAAGTSKRTLSEQSGVNWGPDCSGARPGPHRFPPSECGERSFATRQAALLATWREFDGTLDPGNANPISSPDENRPRLTRESIDFHVSPLRDPFRACAAAPHYARSFPVDVGLRVSDADWNKLRTLRRGRSVTLTDRYGGRCTEAFSPRVCSFTLDLSVTITRTT